MTERASPVRPAFQERSRRTERAIADALSALLRTKPFADITVNEIAAAAQVSVGGLYARFASKEALLAMVELRILEEFQARAAELLAPARFRGLGIAAITHAYVQMLVTGFRERGTEIVQILRYTKPLSETESRLREFNIGVHDKMRALLMERRDEIPSADPMKTINLGLFMASAACREAVLTRNLQVYPVQVTDAELVDEIAGAFYAYVSRSAGPGSSSSTGSTFTSDA